jgi:predicted RecA/RadA family phage recombinase
MANCFNIINEGQQHIALENYTPAANIAKGDIVLIGGRAMVADFGMPTGVAVSAAGFASGGEYEFALADIDGATGGTAAGTAVYITDVGALTLTAASNALFGVVTRNKTATLWVKEF